MAEDEELKTNNELTIGSISSILRPTAVNLGRIRGCKFPDYARHDEARIGFAGIEESSPPAIREKTSLMVSVVFVAAI
jgi:hypothetical protein